MMRDDVPDYTDKITDALNQFHDQDRQIKPLYMLIKVDVDADIVYDDKEAYKYATNHCDKLEYQLYDWYYPDDNEQYPYIAK